MPWQTGAADLQGGVVRSEFIYETAPFPSCHASTIVETRRGLIVAWFGGQHEKAPDVGIWVSRHIKGRWAAPIQVADGVQPGGERHPCWNPVLFQPKKGPLLLFYKVGPSPSTWWGMLKTSDNGGRNWSVARRLPDGFLGPIKNKPVQMPNGDLLCPSSSESDGPDDSWRIHFERTTDLGKNWSKVLPAPVEDGKELNAIQPSILFHSSTKLQAVGRTREGRVFSTMSHDGGRSWGPVIKTALPNPSAGTDAVTLKDGRFLLVYNHTTKGRSPLNVAVSKDGLRWEPVLVLESEPGEFSYPAAIQGRNGNVYVTYTWNRKRIRFAEIDLARLPGTGQNPSSTQP